MKKGGYFIKYINSDVSICKNKNEQKAVEEGLNLIDAKNLIRTNDIVLIIPNWVNPSKPDPKDGVIVGPDTLRYIIEWVKKREPKRIIVGTGSGSVSSFEVMYRAGYDKIIIEEEVEFIDFNQGPYKRINIGHAIPSSLNLNKIFTEATKIISFTQLKQHEESTMSASIKNVVLSAPSTEEHGSPKKDLGIHEDLHGFIAAMALKIKIDLAIVSCNPAMVGTGPSNGVAKHTNLVICGNNPISVDTIGARLLGFKPQGVNYLYRLKQLGFEETEIENINIIGLDLVKAEEIFSEKVYGEKISVDSTL